MVYVFHDDLCTEVGVNMQPDYMIRYEFDQESGDISTDEETIIIGFSTQLKKGILLQITNADPDKPEYISVEMNNNGKFDVLNLESCSEYSLSNF